jgi:hypothetical protein
MARTAHRKVFELDGELRPFYYSIGGFLSIFYPDAKQLITS